jgi:hypothetical protein
MKFVDNFKNKLKEKWRVFRQITRFSRQVALGAGIAALSSASASGTNHPTVSLDPKLTLERRSIIKFAGKYVLKRTAVGYNFLGHMSHSSHSSHSSHRSHSSHYSSSTPGHTSHASHYSSSPTVPSHYSGSTIPAPRNTDPAPVYIPRPVVTTPQYSSRVIFSDYFSEEEVSLGKWLIKALIVNQDFNDANIKVATANGQLVVTPAADVEGRSYSGVTSGQNWDMTAAHARVQVLQITEGTANTVFAIGKDSNNWYGFVTESGKLFLQVKVGARKNSTQVPYSKYKHKFWRLRHEATENLILWETSADGESWTILRKITPTLDLTEMHIYLGAGTYLKEVAPGSALFDNFRFVVHREL